MKNKIPPDLLIILIWIITTFVFIIVPALEKSIVRTILGIPLVLFIPGYVLIATLFPKKDDLDSIERIALSFGLSITIVPLFGLLLNFTFGIRLIPILITLCLYSIVLIFIADYRRSQLPEDLRFKVSFYNIYETIKVETNNQSRTDKILTVILILSIVMATGTLIYVIITPKIGERFTEFYILGPSGKADNYQTELKIDHPTTYLVGISNHEYSIVNYTIKTALDKEILSSKDITLNNNETWEQNLTIIPDIEVMDTKLNFLLFKENNFTEPYRELHLWVNAT